MRQLKDKVALITGSSRGIGAAIALQFAVEGAKVALHGRDKDALQRIKSQVQATGAIVIELMADVTRFAEIEAMRAEIERALGPLDILVANAGGSFTPPAPIEDTPEDGWRAAVEGNLTATFLTIKSFLPGMKKRKSGNIITLSSAAGRKPHARAPIPYSVAKAGIQILTQDVAAEAGPFGVRVNCIAPETILTDRNKQHIPIARQAAMANTHPIQRLGRPEDVADAALFLASDRSQWITGVILDVAGGAVMV
ncbi:MAG: SDR family NAD(P)-dependent oxidoreductase [Methylocella sp.]